MEGKSRGKRLLKRFQIIAKKIISTECAFQHLKKGIYLGKENLCFNLKRNQRNDFTKTGKGRKRRKTSFDFHPKVGLESSQSMNRYKF